MQTDGRLQFLSEPLAATLNTLVPQANKAEQLIHEHILKTTYTVLVDHLQPSTEKTLRHMVRYKKVYTGKISFQIYKNMLKMCNKCYLYIVSQVIYWEKILDRPAGRVAYENVFADNSEYVLGKILLSAPNARSIYTERVIK